MTETPEPRKSPYAVPADRFLGDAAGERAELVVEQPHDPPPDAPPAPSDAGGDGD